MTTSIGCISSINRFPVKSMQGERLDATTLDSLGVAGDRRLALRDLTTGKIVSAKVPKLGIPLLGCRASTTPGGEVVIDIADRRYPAFGCDLELSALIGREVRLEAVTAADEVYASEWPEIAGLALSNMELDLPLAKGTFADLAPLHLLAATSLAHLAALAPDSMIEMARFRPSLLVESPPTSPPFVENEWVGRTARVGGATITFGLAAPRCMMTTLPQGALPRDPQVLQTIAQHNRRDFGGFGDFACLGIYAEVTVAGEVRVGDSIDIGD